MNRLQLLKSKPNPKCLKPHRPLPSELTVTNADVHFYQNGIMFTQTDPKTKRKFYFNPYFIIFMELLYFSRSLISLFVPLTNRDYFVYSGDFMFFIRAKTHINIAATQYMLLGINILVLNYLQYRCNIQPVHLKPFEFLAGKSTVAESGMHNREFIVCIVRKARRAIRLTGFNTKLVCFVSFVLSFIPSLINFTVLENILFGIPWSLVFAISSYFTFSCYFWNMTYFYILCHYIKYRIRETNQVVEKLLQAGPLKKRHLQKLQNRYATISNDVHLYNANYWSKYLFIAIVFLSTFNNTVMYTTLFVDMNVVVRISLGYATLLSSSAIFFVLNTASVVYHESDQIRSLFYCATKTERSVTNLFKISSIIEAFSSHQIGFYFLNLFIINYAKFYEIFSLLIAYFLKIIDLSRN